MSIATIDNIGGSPQEGYWKTFNLGSVSSEVNVTNELDGLSLVVAHINIDSGYMATFSVVGNTVSMLKGSGYGSTYMSARIADGYLKIKNPYGISGTMTVYCVYNAEQKS